MTFTSNLAQQQVLIAAAHEHYRDCNGKLNQLIDQIVATDPWDINAVAEMNKAIGVAERDVDDAWKAWNEAIEAINRIPDEPAKVAKSYLESKGYRSEGDRSIWEPTDPSDLDDFYQHNDEPDLHFDQLADLISS